MGVFAIAPIIICWYVMNLKGHMERSIGTAYLIGFGNTGGVVATFCFLAKDAPEYRMGYSVCVGVVCIGVLAAVVYGALVIRENNVVRNSGDKDHEDMLCL